MWRAFLIVFIFVRYFLQHTKASSLIVIHLMITVEMKFVIFPERIQKPIFDLLVWNQIILEENKINPKLTLDVYVHKYGLS